MVRNAGARPGEQLAAIAGLQPPAARPAAARDTEIPYPSLLDRAVSAKHHGDFIQITESILTRDWILAAIPTIIAYLTKTTVYYMIYEYPTVVLT